MFNKQSEGSDRNEVQDVSLERSLGAGGGSVAASGQVGWRVGAGQSLGEATQAVIDQIGDLGGDGGLIALDAEGNIACPFNSQGMKRAWLTPAGEIGVEGFGRWASDGQADDLGHPQVAAQALRDLAVGVDGDRLALCGLIRALLASDRGHEGFRRRSVDPAPARRLG